MNWTESRMRTLKKNLHDKDFMRLTVRSMARIDKNYQHYTAIGKLWHANFFGKKKDKISTPGNVTKLDLVHAVCYGIHVKLSLTILKYTAYNTSKVSRHDEIWQICLCDENVHVTDSIKFNKRHVDPQWSAFNHLWSHIIWSATESTSCLSSYHAVLAHPKVGYFNMTLAVKHHIVQL